MNWVHYGQSSIAMKPKLILCLALVLSGFLCPQNLQAFIAIIPLNQTNIAAEAPFIRIASIRGGLTNNPVTYFTVFVLLKDNMKGELVSGFLTVNDNSGKGFESILAYTQVPAKELPDGFVPKDAPKSWTGKCKAYSFSVATSLLAHSKFSVEYTNDPKWGTSGTDYTFTLREFADEK
jgi:hypothetical protein